MNNDRVLAVKTDQLMKVFNGKEVVASLTMNVPQGTIYGFLGENGAGKTTVFKMLTGLLSPTLGEIHVLGDNISTHRQRILSNVGCLIETPMFHEHLSVYDNLHLHLAYMGLKQDMETIEHALHLVGLTQAGNLPASKLSLGMRQRLAIARAIVHRPKLLILDEPTNGLDPTGIKAMRELFVQLVRDQGMTLLLSSHILTEVEHIADIIGVIAKGRLVQEISMREIRQSYKNGLEEYYMKVLSEGGKHG